MKPCKHKAHRNSDFCPGLSELEKARERVIRASKKWRKAWEEGFVTQSGSVDKDGIIDASDGQLVRAIDALIKLESTPTKQGERV